MKFKIFWCKVNKYYTDEWLKSEYLKDKDGIFVASCVVTDKAKRKWIKFVKDSIEELSDDEKIFISGCGAFKKWEAQEDFYDIYPELKEFEWKIVILGEKPKELQIEIDNQTKKEWKKQKKLDLSKLPKIPQIYTNWNFKKTLIVRIFNKWYTF